MANAKRTDVEERMRRVIDYYLAMPVPNMMQAMIKGGNYSKASAKDGHKYFARPDAKAYLEERQAELRAKSGVTVEMLIDRLKFIAFGNLAKFIVRTEDGALDYDFSDATEEELQLITDLQVDSYIEGKGKGGRVLKKFKFGKSDPLRAIEMLGRIL